MSPLPDLDSLFAPWMDCLGRDATAYRHHVERLLRLCALFSGGGLSGGKLPDPLAFQVAAVYHDLGIWSDGTFDYLAPSIRHAATWLEANGQGEKIALVSAMIEQHHKLRPAGATSDPVEIFRRADWTDVSLGAIRFGLPYARYRALLREIPDAGFHWKLLELSGRQLLTKPWKPLPMMRW